MTASWLGEGTTPAVAGSAYESRPAVTSTTPAAVRKAGTSRAPTRWMKDFMGGES